jgi:cysteine-rich repeat protein
MTCETGEVLAFNPDGERRLGHVVHPEGKSAGQVLADGSVQFEHGRKLWFWEFLAAIFGVSTAEGETTDTTESHPKEKVDCVTSDWDDWGFCVPGRWNTCWQTRDRDVLASPQHGGSSCGELEQERECDCAPACGNGKITLGEACDDYNHESGDGCSSTCEVEASYECATTQPGSASKYVARRSERAAAAPPLRGASCRNRFWHPP